MRLLLLLLLPLLLAAMQLGAAEQEIGWTSGRLSYACVDCDCGYVPSAFGCGSCCDVVSGSCFCFDPSAGDFGCGCDSSASPRTTSADLETSCCCCCFETCGVVIASLSVTVSGGTSLISSESGRPSACAT